MNILNNINNILLSALTVKQKQLVDKILEKNGDVLKSRYDHIFGVGNNRIYLNDEFVVHVENIKENYINKYRYVSSIVSKYIEIFFCYLNKPMPEDWLLYPDEYLEGKFKVDNREYNIGKILNEMKNNKIKIQNNDNIKKMSENKGMSSGFVAYYLTTIDDTLKFFNSRPSINALKSLDCQVVISRDPYDIAGMSTDRKWKSCMELKNENEIYDKRSKNQNQGGKFRFYIKNDLIEGSLIAYLIDKNDKDIEDPHARVLIKPYVNREGDQLYLSPENKVYTNDILIDSITADKFRELVNDWVKKQQKDLKGKFYANPNLYFDGKASIFTGPSLSLSDAVYKSIQWNILFEQDKMIIKDAIETNYIFKINKLVRLYNRQTHDILFKNKIYMPFIDTEKIKNENYLSLEFPTQALSKENIQHIYWQYKLYLKDLNQSEFISFDEIIRQLKNKENLKNNREIQSFITDLEDILKEDRFDTERYDVILTRNKDINNTDLVLIKKNEYLDYINLDTDGFDQNSNENYYLYTAYLVSSGVTELNRALMKIDMNVVVDIYHLANEYSYDIINEFDNLSDLNSDVDHRVLLADVKNIYIHPEFYNYLEYKDKKELNYLDKFRDRLTRAILEPIDTLELDVYLLTSIYDFDSGNSNSDDRYIPASEDEIHRKEYAVKKEFKNLEKEVFGDSDLNLLSYDKD